MACSIESIREPTLESQCFVREVDEENGLLGIKWRQSAGLFLDGKQNGPSHVRGASVNCLPRPARTVVVPGSHKKPLTQEATWAPCRQ
jgi:hypothetical protein